MLCQAGAKWASKPDRSSLLQEAIEENGGTMQSVLSKATKDQVVTDPYPHIIIEDALDAELYARLSEEFPSRETFMADEKSLANTKYALMGEEALANPGISPLWKDFIRHHTSAAFFGEVVALFGDHFHHYFESVERALGKSFKDMTVGLRKEEYLVPNMRFPHDVILDCQPQHDYSFTARPFRGPHVDSATELYAGLFYMREPGDDSTGGAIAIWRAKDENVVFPEPRSYRFDQKGGVVDRSKLELVYEVPYRANSLVMFVNMWRSLHCAQTRSPTLYPRRAVNIIGEICRFTEPEMFGNIPPPHLLKSRKPRGHRIHQIAKRLLGR